MDYIDKLRSIVNEISDGNGNTTDNENDDNDNFMDSNSSPESQSTPDDSSGDDENDNFMDDGGTEDNTSTDDSSDDENDNFMDDSESSSEESQTPDDSSGDDENDNFMDDGGTEDSSSGESSEESSGEESDNFMDDSGDGESSDGEENPDSSDEGSDDNTEESESNGEEENYDINKIEDELFSSLTPEQIAIKNHELKNQFIEMYSIIGSTLVRINDISKSNDNINILKFVTEKLLELREMIDYNITTAYSTRTYIENNIIYQQCIATLNAIASIIENIPGVNGEIQKSQEEEKEDKGEPVEKDSDSPQILNISDSGASDYQEESTDYNTLF